MKKPEKKTGDYSKDYGNLNETKHLGYNQACDNWEKFLPSEEEIDILIDEWNDNTDKNKCSLPKAISKRIRGD